ncbi:MAG: DUF2878 domain-containing protein [Pseudomonadales bacterium]|nr:DUF2878 domain-containing protein [Pseudomonadales bacterium]
MKSISPVILFNVVAFQLLWAAAVMGAAAGLPWLAWLVLMGMLAGQWWLGGPWRQDLFMMAVGALACLLLEPVWLVSDILAYRDWQYAWLAPGWIWALWMGFAVSFHYALGWLGQHPVAGILLGALGGGFSVIMGIRLGAASAPQGEMMLVLVYALTWSLTVPLLAALARRHRAGRGRYA